MKGAGRVLLAVTELPGSYIITGRHEAMLASMKESKTAWMAEKAANFRLHASFSIKPEIITSLSSLGTVIIRDILLVSKAGEGWVHELISVFVSVWDAVPQPVLVWKLWSSWSYHAVQWAT